MLNCCWQWFPGHIAKAEKELKEQLKLMDVVIEVRDGRIPISTTHPQATISFSNNILSLMSCVLTFILCPPLLVLNQFKALNVLLFPPAFA